MRKISLKSKTSNIIGFYPSATTKTNGIAINAFMDFKNKPHKNPITNGLEIDIDPLSLVMAPIVVFHLLDPEMHSNYDTCYNNETFYNAKKINGLNISFLKIDPIKVNGLNLQLFGAGVSITNGMTVSAIMNKHSKINGITVSTFGNHDIVCNGIQIGLFNSCAKLKGIQLGLWNKNQRRSFPFINWNFK